MSCRKRAGQQQVAIHLRIVARRQVADREQRHHVIEQAADKGVMQRLGRGRILVGGTNASSDMNSWSSAFSQGFSKLST